MRFPVIWGTLTVHPMLPFEKCHPLHQYHLPELIVHCYTILGIMYGCRLSLKCIFPCWLRRGTMMGGLASAEEVSPSPSVRALLASTSYPFGTVSLGVCSLFASPRHQQEYPFCSGKHVLSGQFGCSQSTSLERRIRKLSNETLLPAH